MLLGVHLRIQQSPLSLRRNPKKELRRKLTVILTPRNPFGSRSLNWNDSFLQVSYAWYMDSGCSRHMTGCRSFLSDYVVSEEERVKFGGKERGTIRGYGTITDGSVVIKDVRYVEGLDHNLFSSSQFCDNGHLVTQFVLGCTVNDKDGRELLHGKRIGNLYTFHFKSFTYTERACLISKTSKENSWLWHRRLSHQNFQDINKLIHKKLINGLPNLKII